MARTANKSAGDVRAKTARNPGNKPDTDKNTRSELKNPANDSLKHSTSKAPPRKSRKNLKIRLYRHSSIIDGIIVNEGLPKRIAFRACSKSVSHIISVYQICAK